MDVKAAETTEVMSQDNTFEGQQVLEVVAPIYLENERWGVVRLGLSLKNLTEEIRQTQEMAHKKLEHGVLLSLLLASLLTAFRSAAGATVAARLLNPLRGEPGASPSLAPNNRFDAPSGIARSASASVPRDKTPMESSTDASPTTCRRM